MVELPKPYQDVYETSKDIVRLKQRHLIKEVLERLNDISLPQDTLITTLSGDQVRYFFCDILSLIIDSDSTLQADAITALAKFLAKLKPSAYQSSSEWPVIRDRIVEDYTRHICKVRDSSNNANWFKMWCLLMHVLDQDIIRSVLIINKFLAIVEQSFKSPDLEVRAQAFLCWKILVKIFFKYNELIPTKRVKLVSIPFRSSQAKNVMGAEAKLEAYWYFLVKLSESQITAEENFKNSLELHQELIFGPFLQFCFGNSVKGGISTLKQFPKMKEISVIVLIAMLNPNNKEIEVQLENFNLEKPKESIVTDAIMQSNWKAIIRSCFEASLIVVEQGTGRKKLLELLWHGLVHQILQTKNAEIYKECCIIIKQLIQTDKENPELLMKPNIIHIVETFGTHYNYLYDLNSNTANYVQIFEIITCITEILVLSEDHYFPPDVCEQIAKNIYDIEKYKNLTKFWELLKDLIEYILTTDQLNDFTNFQIKIAIWRTLSMTLRSYMDAKLFEFRLQSKSEVINKWIVWPLKKCGWLDDKNSSAVNKILDNNFFITWKRIMYASSQAEGKSNFVNLLIPSIKMLCDKREKIPNFDEVVACYIDCMDKNFDKTSKPTEALEFIKTVLAKTPSKNSGYNKIIEKFTKFICSINDNQFGVIFNEFNSITAAVVQAEKSKHINKNSLEMFKKAITDLLKKDTFDKKYIKEFRSALKFDEFVIIPSVWALNPDRLTEHQKEKMKEKKDHIPALYNDMNTDSHSQDSSSIKPWTPNKIVMSRGKEQLVINSPKTSAQPCVAEDDKNLGSRTEPNKQSPFKVPKESSVKKVKGKLDLAEANTNFNNKKTESVVEAPEKENIETIVVKDSKEKQKEEPVKGKVKTPREKELKFKFSKEDELLLKSMNIEIKDEKKKSYILNNLKALQIDTVEGKTLLKTQLKKDTGLRTRKSLNPKRITGEIKKKGITNENKKKRGRKSETIKKEKESDTEEQAKENNTENNLDKSKTTSKVEEKKVVETSKEDVMQPPKKTAPKVNNTSLQSEDEVVESSQKSKSITGRRLRKPSLNGLEENKKNMNRRSSNKSPKKVDNAESGSLKKIELNTSVEGKSRPLRSSSISPLVQDDKKKELKMISEMDTELNTEIEVCESSVIQSPSKLSSSRISHNSLLAKIIKEKENQVDNSIHEIGHSNENTQQETIKAVANSSESNNSILRNNLLPESENLIKTNFLSKSPKKRLIYDKCEDLPSKGNARVTRNVSKDLDIEEKNVDSLVVSSLVQLADNPIEKHIKNTNTESSSKVQKLLNNILNENSPRPIRSSPRKSPSTNQQNTEINVITTELQSLSPKKITSTTKISEMDTEPNTEYLNTSVSNAKEKSVVSPVTPKREGDVYKYIEDRAIESPAYSPIKPFQSSSIKRALNQSIVASPECRNTDEKNAEFMNDTLNISPIPVDEENNGNHPKNSNAVADANRLFDELKAVTENAKTSVEDFKQLSPSRKSTRPGSLNSPPDRKNTSTSSSPVPKPKAQTSLYGRGAQLINMIRNRKIDPSNRFASSPFRNSKTEELSSSQEKLLHQQQQNLQNSSSPPKRSIENNDGTDMALPTPVQMQPVRDLLTFSKVLPSPYASPSCSILKRKLRKDSFDDFDSPANKRKRVSFHDPPVSVTKEYERHQEEHQQLKMLQDRTSTPTYQSIKHSLKRKNRMDSMLELARYNDSPNQQSNVRMIEIPHKSIENVVNATDVAETNNEQQLPFNSVAITELHECDSSKQMLVEDHLSMHGIPQTSVEMETLKFNATADSTTNPQHIHQRQCNIHHLDDDDDNELLRMTPSPSIYFTDEAAVLKYVVEKYGFDEIYEKYSAKKENKEFLTNKLVRTIFKDLSSVMEKDVRIKTNVLEMLSEKHPKEFLDHAIQENLSSVVCERLNTNSVIDYICETFKSNADSRKMILDKISNIITTDRFNEERHEYFMKLINYEKMTNQEIINCIEIMTKNRR